MGDISIHALQQEVVQFRDARDWKQFHDPKDVAISLALEAAELLELYQWKQSAAVAAPRVAEELSDVLYWVLLMAHDQDIDLPTALRKKLEVNASKYPVDRSRGVATKYTELGA